MRLSNRVLPGRTVRAAGLVPVVLAAIFLTACSAPPAQQEADPEPGQYLSPLVRTQRLQGANDHLHISEVRLNGDGLLLQCSYEFGVVDAGEGGRMRYLAEGLRHEIPGDYRPPGCIHLAAAGDLVYTTHRGTIRNPAFLSGWDITDPGAPMQLPVLQEPGISYEGVATSGDEIFVGLHENGLGVYRHDPAAGFSRIGATSELTNAWGVRARGDTVYVTDGEGELVIVDASDPTAPTVLGRVTVGGKPTDVALDGDHAYVAAGSEGLVIVDVSDSAAPTVLGRAAMPGSAIRVDASAGHAFVAAWNDARVYDVSDPARPRFVAAARHTRTVDRSDPDRPDATSRVLGIAARGRDVFVGNWHVLYSYRLFPERRAPSIRLPETASLVDAGAVAAGERSELPFEIANQGTAPLTVIDSWVAGDAWTVSPRRLRLEPGEVATVSIAFEPASDEPQRGYLQILSDDPDEPLRRAYLVANRPGLTVGMELPETRATLLDGREWTSTEARGTVTLMAFFATF